MSVQNSLIGAFNIAIGCEAGIANQKQGAVAIGAGAGHNNQGVNSIAIGKYSGYNNQPANSIVISASDDKSVGSGVGAHANAFYVAPIRTDPTNMTYNLNYNTATSEVTYSLTQSAVGATGASGLVANITKDNGAIAISNENTAGSINQGDLSVAIGSYAGETNQRRETVAIGYYAGNLDQHAYSVAIGNYAGTEGQRECAIAIGSGAGQINQGTYSIAIGINSACQNQPENSIVISASGSTTVGTTDAGAVANAFYVTPIRTDPTNMTYNLNYNTATSEVTYSQSVPASNVYFYYDTATSTLLVKALDGTVLRTI